MHKESIFNEKSILITGGTGTFGKKCVDTLLKTSRPKKIIVFSRDELKQYELAQKFSPIEYGCMRYFIGDVRDKERLYRAFRGVDYVIHAAALKQVPTAEYNPTECIHTNVQGAENIIEAAVDNGVKKVIALSTDKAVAPINLYGATKLCSDKLFIAANAYVGQNSVFSVVRYGNVMGSRGSVIPLFLKQKLEGRLTITDKRMTRFWITQEHAVNLVLRALEISAGGEIFVPHIPSMKIIELAKAIAPEATIVETGIRPGEKMHEIMITSEDARNTIDIGDFYIIKPSTFSYKGQEGKKVEPDFVYSSDTNDQWLDKETMLKLVRAQSCQ